MQLSEHRGIRVSAGRRRANATLRPGTYMLDMARGPGSLNAHMTLREELRSRRRTASPGALRVLQRAEQAELQQPADGHQQRELRQNHGSGRRPHVPVGRPYDVLAACYLQGGRSSARRERRGRPRFRITEAPEIEQIQAFATKSDNPRQPVLCTLEALQNGRSVRTGG